ncbi:MAG TPA: site-2 protease family protein [Vicinamibacterales bacterium]|nr:site-2 protease family protein [Vicinamibacterales bacterium]
MEFDVARIVIGFTVLLLSLSFHEAAHAWSADALGDPTARRLGRVSLNPVVHIDPIGTLLFPLIAMFTNLPLIGWAKPVPVNPANLHGHWKRKYMMIAAAGPASNLALAVIGAIGVRIIGFEGGTNPATSQIFQFLLMMVVLNVLLAVFNMLPVPPLDGGNVLMGLLRGRASELFNTVRPFGMIILYALLISGILWQIVEPVQDAILRTLL